MWVRSNSLPNRHNNAAYLVSPVVAGRRRQNDTGKNRIYHKNFKALAIRYVVVEGHCPRSEPSCQRTHRQGVETFAVYDFECGFLNLLE